MSTTLHFSAVAVAVASATSQASGYSAANTSDARIRKEWRSTSLSQQQLILDYGATVTHATIWLHETNAVSALVETAVSTVYATAGALSVYEEPHGRRKGWIDASGLYRYARVTIASGTPSDGLGYWRIGSVFSFASKIALPMAPQYGATLTVNFPQIAQVLTNGRTVTADVAAAFSTIALDFRAKPSQDVTQLLRMARLGTVGLALGDTSRPWDAWPVAHVAANSQRRLEMYESDSRAIELQEQV